MFKTISSFITWVCNKTRKRISSNESEEWEGGIGAPYRPRTDYYYSNHGKGEKVRNNE